jgi:exodeoxyribonuclease V alpha subunit
MKAGEAGMNSLNAALQLTLNPPAIGKAEYEYVNTTFRVGDKVMQTANNYQQEWTRNTGRSAITKDEGPNTKDAGEISGTDTGSGVYNGDIGVITAINRQNGEIVVELEDGRVTTYTRADLSNLVLAYAITVHKSQGCEFDVVIIPVTSGAYMVLTRNLLYTAVTRAKRMVMLVGSIDNLQKMVNNTYTKERFSMLKDFLTEMSEKARGVFE